MNTSMIRTMNATLAVLLSMRLTVPADAFAQTVAPSAVGGIRPNRAESIERPLRYQPDGDAFVIRNGVERFNRSLYGGNTAFRVDGGDKPEFVVYLPGRGGNLRFAFLAGGSVIWLHDAAEIETRYRPGELSYEVRDPRLGSEGAVLRLTVLAYHETEGLIVECSATGLRPDVELLWAFGGINGQRGARDGDIGTEKVPISEWFQPRPEFAEGNRVGIAAGQAAIAGKPATLAVTTRSASRIGIGNADFWNEPARLFGAAGSLKPDGLSPSRPLAIGRLSLDSTPTYLSFQRVSTEPAAAGELDIYSAVTAPRAGESSQPAASSRLATAPRLPAAYPSQDLPLKFTQTREHFAALRRRVSIETPDPYLNAAVGALNVAADAVWDEPQQAIMHGAIAWRAKLLGWRGPYALDALGWHDRAIANFRYWLSRQNTSAVPDRLPPADENSNLARSEAALHSNGDMANAHYDMNAVFIDALFRHLDWTGDLTFAREAWPVIERHLAWERRLFRREFGSERLPLYEAYAQIWASDDIQYNGGGVAYASAYNLYHNKMAARLAGLLGHDAAPYIREAALIGRGMRKLLWLPREGAFAEYKDLSGRQLVHPSAGLWSFYHTIDSGVPTAQEAWSMALAVERDLPRLPVRGAGVPTDAAYEMFATTNWMPYSWSVNNVVMGENLHTALGFWQAGRPEAAFKLTKSSVLASMYMGISPGNVGSMNYLDVYRREAQRDFADGSGVMSRAIVEGLFGVRPDALAGMLTVQPGFPAAWTYARLNHPDVSVAYSRTVKADLWTISQSESRFRTLRLQLPATHSSVAGIKANGQRVSWRLSRSSPRRVIEIEFAAKAVNVVSVQWRGSLVASKALSTATRKSTFAAPLATLSPATSAAASVAASAENSGTLEPVNLTPLFNDKVTEIFRSGKYRSPRSPFASLALPSQGIGAWAGHVNATAAIDDSGLRRKAAEAGGEIRLPNGTRFVTPTEPESPNIIFTSQWDNYPDEVVIPLSGNASAIHLLMAGSTNPMQSRIDNGEVVVTYTDGATARLALHNPTTWWPIDQDYLVDDYQFQLKGPPPLRVDLKTGNIRQPLERGGTIDGGSATILSLPLDHHRSLRSITLRTLANDVVIGLMSATLVRPQ